MGLDHHSITGRLLSIFTSVLSFSYAGGIAVFRQENS
jgi:hypothetical protein